MKSYITKPLSLKKNEIISRFHSFLPSEHRKVNIINTNIKTIQEIQEFENVGTQIDVSDYLSFTTQCYLGTISCMQGLLYNEKKGENISPENYKKSSKKLQKGDFIISRNASLGKISYVHSDSNIILNGGLSYLRILEKYRWYFPAFFITNYGAEYLICSTSGGGTQQNAKRQNLLDVKIPFPTHENHPNPEKIEEYISCITQNIIDKEEQIQKKNRQIDELIEKELKENQKENTFKYSYPKISDIKKETRLDTGLYEREFKEIEFLIKNYKRGINYIEGEKIFGGNTPKNRIFGKGNLWLTPTDCKRGILKVKSLIKTTKYNLYKDSLVIVNRSNVGETVLYKKDIFGPAQHNQGMYRIEIEKGREIYNIFILNWFDSKIFQDKYISNISTGATFKEIRINDISDKSPIPNFPESKQQEIAKLYYNPLEKNKDLILENYLEKEKVRNGSVGIFQLNMEIFELRERLEELVDAVVIERKVEIVF